MGGQALMEHGEVAELEGAARQDEVRAAISALAVLTALLLLAALISAVIVSRRADDVSIATLQRAAARVGDARSMHVEIDTSFGFGESHSVADYDNVAKRGRVSFELGDSRLDAVADAANVYFLLPPDLQAKFGGKPCAVMDAAAAAVAGPTLSTAVEGQSALDYLAGANGKVHDLGTEVIHGVSTHKYVVDVDLAEVISRMAPAQRAGAEDLSGFTGAAIVPIEVWLDEDDVVRQVRVTLDLGEVHGTTTTRFDPSDQPVDVEIPAAGTCATAADAQALFALFGD